MAFNGTRTTSIFADVNKELIPSYNEREVQWIARAAVTRAKKKGVVHDTIDTLYTFLKESLQRNPTCEACANPFQKGNGSGPAANSLTLHRRHPNDGYVTSNLHCLCHSCNLAIGESDTKESLDRRRKALDWQEKKILTNPNQ